MDAQQKGRIGIRERHIYVIGKIILDREGGEGDH